MLHSEGMLGPDWGGENLVVIKETRLSRKPARGSLTVACSSVSLLVLSSLVYWTNTLGLAEFLSASRDAVFVRGEYWRLGTSIGVHADLGHLLANALPFGVLSFLLYGYYGALVYPALVLFLGVLVTALAVSTYPAYISLLGASGVVYLMAAMWLTLYLLVDRRVGLQKRILRAVGFCLIVLVPTTVEPTVSYRAHAIGFGLGVAAALVYFSRWRDSFRSEERIELE
ncbi:MAG TPA: rhomboid family intramembrane serine protease [Vicinamibacteria bacterium]|nr:rhomboid family intramembrane serine protease [Vicinamibacteria bacterium]